MLVQVKKATYIDKFIIDLDLNTIENDIVNIVHKQVDLEEYLKNKKDTGIFAPIKNIEYFKKFKLNANTIEWENGADIAPERFLEI